MFKLIKTKNVNEKDNVYVAYRKRRFGSNYPNLSNDEVYEMKQLFRKSKTIRLGNIEHPIIYYKALYLSKKLDDMK